MTKQHVASEDELRRDYKKSTEEFTKKYEGKEVLVWGKAGMVSTDTGLVSFESSGEADLAGTPTIMCYADEGADRARFKDLHIKSGDFVQLKGLLTLDGAYTMKLTHCELEKFGLDAVGDS